MSNGINKFAKVDVGMNISRSRLDRSWGNTTTFKSGDLIPIFCDDVLPGDTFRIDYSMVTRMLTPVAPTFGNAYFDIYFFFIPNRLVADYGAYRKVWEQLQGENTSGYWANQSEMTLEQIEFSGAESMSVANYLGLPIKGQLDGNYSKYSYINSLALKGYTLLWNEFFRDQNVEAPKDINTYGFSVSNRKLIYTGQDTSNYGKSGSCLKVAKLHDYFTSALPAPQKGESVKIGTSGFAPVYSLDSDGDEVAVSVSDVNGVLSGGGTLATDNDGNLVDSSLADGATFNNLYADLAEATAATINNLRQAFAIQRILEIDAVGGSRYREMLKAHFSVTIPDYTAQVPEYLGGKRVPINVTQVLQTSNNTGTISQVQANHIGQVGAFSNTSDRGYLVNKSFNEFGIILGVCCVRTEQQYSQGIPRMFTKFRRFDYYLPAFKNLGEQAILNKELFVTNDPAVNDEVFGYQESWAEYRYHPNMLTGNFGAGSNDATLGAWSYGNEFASLPALNADFIHQSPTNIGDTLYDTNTTTQFYGDFFFSVDCTRAMPVDGTPGHLLGRW